MSDDETVLTAKIKFINKTSDVVIEYPEKNITITIPFNTEFLPLEPTVIVDYGYDRVELTLNQKLYGNILKIIYILLACNDHKWVNLFEMISKLSKRKQVEYIRKILYEIDLQIYDGKITAFPSEKFDEIYSEVKESFKMHQAHLIGIEKKRKTVERLIHGYNVYFGRKHMAMLIYNDLSRIREAYGIVVKEDGSAYIKELDLTFYEYRSPEFYEVLNLVNGSTIGMKKLEEYIKQLGIEERKELLKLILLKLRLKKKYRERFIEKYQEIIGELIAEEI